MSPERKRSFFFFFQEIKGRKAPSSRGWTAMFGATEEPSQNWCLATAAECRQTGKGGARRFLLLPPRVLAQLPAFGKVPPCTRKLLRECFFCFPFDSASPVLVGGFTSLTLKCPPSFSNGEKDKITSLSFIRCPRSSLRAESVLCTAATTALVCAARDQTPLEKEESERERWAADERRRLRSVRSVSQSLMQLEPLEHPAV